MFTNLIESDSHTKEFKRRSSFFFATVVVYTLIFAAAGIFGILAFDAQVEAQSTDWSIDVMIPPVKPAAPRSTPREVRPTPRRTTSNAPIDPHLNTPMRTEPAVASVTDSTKPPDTIGTTGPAVPPSNVPVIVGNRNADPPSSGGSETGNCTNCPDTGVATAEPRPTPAPTPVAPQGPQRVPSTVLLAKVIDLPKPAYPQIAKMARMQGPVNVQILVDESGRVVSAHAVSGNAMLTKAAEEAARRARFTPTMLGNHPVKVQGVITYNFVLQ